MKRRWFQRTVVALVAVAMLAFASEAFGQSFVATAPLAHGRQDHTATLLSNEKVVVAGGLDSAPLSSVELYDPNGNTWSSGAAMATARVVHSAVLLASGKVLVIGGCSTGIGNSCNHMSLNSAELYDPAADAWSPAGTLGFARSEFTATLLPSGKVLVAGGVDGDKTVEIYDPNTNTWSPAASMSTDRFKHTATLLANGKVLVVGGGVSSGASATCEIYDPASNTWSAAGSLATSRYKHSAVRLASGKVLVAGGATGTPFETVLASAEVYDPATNAWSPAGSMSVTRDRSPLALLSSGKVLIASGLTGPHGGDQSATTGELYDPSSNTWSVAGTVVSPRFSHTTTLLGNGKVLVAGGGDAPSSSAELFSEATTVAGPALPCWAVWALAVGLLAFAGLRVWGRSSR